MSLHWDDGECAASPAFLSGLTPRHWAVPSNQKPGSGLGLQSLGTLLVSSFMSFEFCLNVANPPMTKHSCIL